MDLVTKEDIQIIKGKYFLPYIKYNAEEKIATHKKIVILDLDETLGSFSDLYLIWSGIRHVWPECSEFVKLVDLYPEFFRYGILTILEYIYQKKIQRICSKLVLYTNNQCSQNWVNMICQYMDLEVKRQYPHKTKLFDQIIGPYRIGTNVLEGKRTTHKKKMSDLLNYFPYDRKSQFCFIDDVLFNEMKGKNVFYICPKPYVHVLTLHEMIRRMRKAAWVPEKYRILNGSSYWRSWFSLNRHYLRRKENDPFNDLNISRKMFIHLREFMDYKKIVLTNKTSKKIKTSHKRTRKTNYVRSPSVLSTPLM